MQQDINGHTVTADSADVCAAFDSTVANHVVAKIANHDTTVR
jgi:hypothetical protein